MLTTEELNYSLILKANNSGYSIKAELQKPLNRCAIAGYVQYLRDTEL
jgi:hypothetical protein